MFIQQYLPLLVYSFFLLLAFIFFRRGPDGSNAAGRDEYIDGVRGLAAISVVATHAWRLAAQGSNYTFDFPLRENYGSLGVQIFFCITGFLFFGQLYSRPEGFNWNTFYRSRIRRLVPAYFVSFILGTSLILALGNWSAFKPVQINHLIDMLFFGFKGNGNNLYALGIEIDRFFSVIWTLTYEIKFYLAFPFIVWACSTKRSESTALCIALAALAYEIAYSKTTFSGYFLTGALCAKFLRNIAVSLLIRKTAAAAAILATFASLSLDFKAYGFERFIISSVLFASIVIAKPRILSIRPLTGLGDISYSIYLMHAPVLMLTGFALEATLVGTSASPLQFILITFCAVTLVFAAAYASYRWIELPFLRSGKAAPEKKDTTEQKVVPA
ncbi:acyltransferase family protein [Pseudomonas sp. BGr12]|uniref:acyltransferase family protein n=1 Tax=Pseudomonas sp. BGr12 TaxID=2936269 RepID=UPI00255A3531|nr:acyltransferase [Pseudomonas sp. BJa5]MDL2430140.1 acyltransferase [Pseudomonas sp. BJa5]